MELAGISMDNFPPVVNDSKTLRKLSLLEARMVGAGNESRDASLPANESSRGSDNNSNSMSTIGFPKQRSVVAASPGEGEQSHSRGRAGAANGPMVEQQHHHEEGVGGAKRKSPADEAFSPPRPPTHSQNGGTPSTLSTSPGESRNWNTARPSAQETREESTGWKRARSGTTVPPPPPAPPRFSLPHSDGDRQTVNGAGTVHQTAGRVQQGHTRKSGSPDAKAIGRTDRSAHGRDQAQGTKSAEAPLGRAGADALAGNGSLPPPASPSNAQGCDFSPQSGRRGVAGVPAGANMPQGGATKTIQSYFFKPSNGSGMQALAASYASGEGGVSGVGGGVEVDLSGVDDEKGDGESLRSQGLHRAMARNGKSGSLGASGGNAVGSLQHRTLNAAASATADQGVVQGHGRRQDGHSTGGGNAAGGGGARGGEKADTQAAQSQENVESLLVRLKEEEASMKRLRKELDRANLERSGMEAMADTLQKQLDRKIAEFKAQEAEREAQKTQLTSVVERLLRKVSAQEASDCRAKLTKDTLELGKIVSVKTGHIGKYVEAFEEGHSFKEVDRKFADLLARKTKLEARKRAVTKLLKASPPSAGEEQPDGQARLEAVEEDETVRMHLASLKREEVALQEEKRALDARKVLHIRELKRVAHEDRSKFSQRPTLSGRYVLLNLLGKGGFSEVWRAFDLVLAADVAVKVHQLLNNWSEPQKANFIRHVTREYEIHQQMRHPRIVNLTDVFEICCDSFATVLDYCRGTDLECLLRERKQLPERDARALVLQVARGLLYLNTAQGEGRERRGAIIHYDLKPGNILLDENGDVKITDFGLSKILEIKKDTERGTAGGTSMELTSKGAGTYWYLPPECFGDNPRISSKVDVWSLGVVFYQMLYGVRPFGEGLSQERILREKVIVNANRVEFPSKPVVSEEAKSFIRSCLTYTHATRPDVHAMCNLPYLTTPMPKRGA